MTLKARADSARNRDIEVLRAVAITFVIALHWVPHFLGRFGSLGRILDNYTALWSGVDLFFCVSGYVITKSIKLESSTDASIRNCAVPFWIRRIFRLWPSAWLWAVIPFILSIAWSASGKFGVPARTATDVIMAILNVENFHYYRCLENHTCGALSVYWSLSLEEQFYWIFPIAILMLRRRTLIATLAVVATVQILIPRPASFLSATPSLLWLVRTDAICLGVLLALLERPEQLAKIPRFLQSQARAAFATGSLLVVLAVAASPALGIPQATGVLALASAGLVWMARFNCGLIAPVSMMDPVLLWLGSRSYSLYLTHLVAGRFASELRDRIIEEAPRSGSTPGVLLGVSMFVIITIATTELNFRFVETPLRVLGRRFAVVVDRGEQVARPGIPSDYRGTAAKERKQPGVRGPDGGKP